MKKRWTILLGALALMAACFAIWSIWLADTAIITMPEKAASGEGRTMRAELTLDAGTRTLRGTQSFEGINETGEDLDGLTLRREPGGRAHQRRAGGRQGRCRDSRRGRPDRGAHRV